MLQLYFVLGLNVLEIPFLLILSTMLVPPAKRDMEMPGIEPGAFHMQSERATTALHPLPCATNFSMLDLKNFLFMTDGRISLWTKS